MLYSAKSLSLGLVVCFLILTGVGCNRSQPSSTKSASSSTGRSAQQTPYQVTPVNAPPHLSCEQFANYVEQTGVPGGTPGEAGHTSFQFKQSGSGDAVDPKEESAKYICAEGNCGDHTPYDTVEQCREHCKEGLKCTLPPRTCLATHCFSTSVDAVFTADIQSKALVWSDPPDTQACRADVGRYRQEITAHETGHDQDLQKLLDSTNAAWKKKRFTACGHDFDEIQSKLKSQIGAAVTDQLKSLNEQAQALSDRYHQEHGLGAVLPSCEICK